MHTDTIKSLLTVQSIGFEYGTAKMGELERNLHLIDDLDNGQDPSFIAHWLADKKHRLLEVSQEPAISALGGVSNLEKFTPWRLDVTITWSMCVDRWDGCWFIEWDIIEGERKFQSRCNNVTQKGINSADVKG